MTESVFGSIKMQSEKGVFLNNPTDHFTILERHDQEIGPFHVVRKRKWITD